MSRNVFRLVVPVDGRWHSLALTGPIIHVATRHETAVEIWYIEDIEDTPVDRAFRVVGTGHPLAPALATHVGTAITPSGRFVWHLFEHPAAIQ